MVTNGKSGTGFGLFALGFLVAFLVLFVGASVYLKYGHPPVATADAPFPMEEQVVHVPLGVRIASELKKPPVSADEGTLEAGAKIYVKNCASCHGTPGRDVPYAQWMYPAAPPLWEKHQNNNVVGVSDDETGETYWKVSNGIRLTGMPAYQHILSETEMWQVSLLLKNADQPLSPAVAGILSAPANQP
jgi:thiosulfate dehydrogenase